MKKQLQQLIAQGKTEQVLQRLLIISDQLRNKDLREEVLLLAARYEEYAKNKRQETLDLEGQQISIAKINQALLYIIDQLPINFSMKVEGGVSIAFGRPKNRFWWRMVVGLGVITGIIVVILKISNFNIMSIFEQGLLRESLQLTVYVHGPKSRQDIILENEGKLILDIRNDRRVAQIGENGRTNFGEIDRNFLGKEISLFVQAGGFVMAHPDTNYIYNGNPIYMAVKKDKSLGHICGSITGENGKGLEDVIILIENDTSTQTDSLGRFRLILPEERIQDNYKLNIMKEGYKKKSRTYYPNSSIFELELSPVEKQ